ncbi:Type 1 glutamine amidotransferase-like domain-containing protein [Paenisporosarcina sp. FSL H8-0542]|uniref:Type 1 glutamine amidotransferase-like domain-containing protein n=1 Tax=Paenisporosarcina sp. FSL H8-0542 TaxID=2921401 RepID=UPI003159F14F
MGHLLLTSTGFFHEKVREQFIELISNRKSAVIITTASAQKESNPFAIQARVDLLDMGFEQVTFLDVEREKIDCLRTADVIYLNGGNPFRLLHALRESGADELLQMRAKEDCVIVGVSAGAVVLGASIRIVDWFSPSLNTMNLKNFKGCELYKSSLFPHVDRIDLFPGTTPIEERIHAFEKTSGEHVLRLVDSEFKIMEI